MSAANDEVLAIDNEDVARISRVVVAMMAMRGGMPLPFTLLVWAPDGVKHASAGIHKHELIEPLKALVEHWAAEHVLQPLAPTTSQ